MRRITFTATVAVLGLLLFMQSLQAKPSRQPVPVIAADAYVLFDANSHQLLLDKHARKRISPAALTKLMTAYVALHAIQQGVIDIDQQIIATEQAVTRYKDDNRMWLKTGQEVSVKALLHGLIIAGGNDAALLLAHAVAESETAFVQQMNATAKRLGLENSHFTNITGHKDAQHYSTPEDLARLAAALIDAFPQYYPVFSERDFNFNNVEQVNKNRLLWLDPFADGLLASYSKATGYSLIASVKRGQHRMIAVVYGAASHNVSAIESQKLLNYGFQQFDLVRLYQKQQTVADVTVWRGVDNTTPIGFQDDLYLTLPKGQSGQLKATVEIPEVIYAPISAGQTLGEMVLSINNREVNRIPMTALQANGVANVFARGWDEIRLLLE